MNSKSKKKLVFGITAGVAGLALIVAIIWFYTDGQIKKAQSALRQPSETTLDAAALIESADKVYLARDNTLSADMRGVIIDLADVCTDASDFGSVASETEEVFSYLTNFLPDTLFILPDTGLRFSALKNSDGSAFDLISYFLSVASQKEMKTVLVADSRLAGDGGAVTAEAAAAYLTKYPFEGVMFTYGALGADPYSALSRYHDEFSSSGILIGAVSPGTDASVPEWAARLAAEGKIDFIAADISKPVSDSSMFVQNALANYDSFASSYPSVCVYCVHHAEKRLTYAEEWASPSEINSQMRLMREKTNLSGSIFYDLKALMADYSVAQRISVFIYDGEDSALSVREISFSPDASSVVFTGDFAEGSGLYVNGEKENTDASSAVTRTDPESKDTYTAGTYSLTKALVPGENVFSFVNAGKELTYNIEKNGSLFLSCDSPSGTCVAGDGVFSAEAVCPSGARVYLFYGGAAYRMIPSGSSPAEGYINFEAAIRLNFSADSDTVTSTALVYAVSGEISEARSLGDVTVTATPAFTGSVPADTTRYEYDFGETSKPTPYKDNGLGQAQMVRFTFPHTEQLGPNYDYDTYHPDLSTVPAGTVDYVEKTEVSEAGYLRYVLRSGIRVYALNCELIANGYVMPDNNITAERVDDSDPNSTDLYFTTDWLSPVTVTTDGADFKKGYLGFSYNIDSFNATYCDVRFNYAGAFYNMQALTFSSDSVFSAAELYTDNSGSLILRLKLRSPGRFYGFMINETENGCVISFRKRGGSSLSGKTVMLDAGHGGLSMTGTAVRDESIDEAEVTLSIAFKLKAMLENMGATVIMTRSLDTSVTLTDRAQMCEEATPDIFVSIHCDGSDDLSQAGTHTFYFRSYSMPLAQNIHSSLVATYSEHIYSEENANYSKIDKGIKYYPFFVTRTDTCPSVLIETGFMTNLTEGAILSDDNCRYWIADGIANGIKNYFETRQ